MSKKITQDSLKIRGFFRLQIGLPNKNGKIVDVRGDSGWKPNQIVNGGYVSFLQFALIASAGSKTASHAAIGTGTAPAASATTLPGEITDAATCRCALTTGTSGSKTVVFTFTLNSNVITQTWTIQNVGLFSGSTTSSGTLFAGNTYATSQLQTNMAVNGTYNIIFG